MTGLEVVLSGSVEYGIVVVGVDVVEEDGFEVDDGDEVVDGVDTAGPTPTQYETPISTRQLSPTAGFQSLN